MSSLEWAPAKVGSEAERLNTRDIFRSTPQERTFIGGAALQHRVGAWLNGRKVRGAKVDDERLPLPRQPGRGTGWQRPAIFGDKADIWKWDGKVRELPISDIG